MANHPRNAFPATLIASTLAVAAVMLACPAAVEAQGLTLDRSHEVGSAMALVEGRDADLIRDEMTTATELRFRLEARIEDLEDLLAEAKARVEVKKNEIEIIETEKNLADRQERDTEKERLEAEKKYEEAVKKVLERTVTYREREIELAEAQREAAQAAIRVHERELALVRVNDEFAALQGSGGVRSLERAIRLERDVSDREKELLESLRDRARRKQSESERERRVYEAQLEILEARKDLREIEN
ncbi:MAG: hypothetical protein KJP18_05055 [Gemmatimonadetes bacterium]|nr:hypothetical protein [Gemmatimonadota bacterium]